MKKDDSNNPKNNMVARQEPPRNTFIVQKNEPNQADQLTQEVADEEKELQAVLDGIAQRQADLADKKRRAEESARQEKIDVRAGLLDDAADWREMARTHTDPVKGKEFLRRAKEAETEATRLGAELNLNDPLPDPTKAPKILQPLSTNKALLYIGALFALSLLLTWLFGTPLAADPNNATGQSILHNAPIRALLSFTLTFLTFLVATFFIRVAFPQFYRIWHNRIDSERSLESLLNESPAWAVLLFLLGLFYMFMQLFASYYQAMFS